MKAFIIVAGWGEYSNRYELPVVGFLAEDAAKAAMQSLELISGRDEGGRKYPWDVSVAHLQRIKVEMAAQYAKLGFLPQDHDYEDADWSLHTVEIL